MENWHPGMSMGHQMLDDAHQQLEEFADLAEQAIRAGNTAALLAGLRAIFRSSADHFAMEERIMVETRYLEAEEHRESHAAFMIELRSLLQEAERHGITGGVRLWFDSRLTAWMRYHVKGRDAALGRHLHRVRMAEQARAAAEAAQAAHPQPQATLRAGRGR